MICRLSTDASCCFPTVRNLPRLAHTLPPLHARLSLSMTAVAVRISNGKNASSIVGNRRSVKVQIQSSGLLPRSIALSCALSPVFHRLLSSPDVSALCISPGMVNTALHSLAMFSPDGVTKASASAVTALYEKTWPGRLPDFGNDPGKMC